MQDQVSRVCVWDGRMMGEKPMWVFAESHGDDVSFVGFAGGEEGGRWGVSGGMDGLVNVFDLLTGKGAAGGEDDERALWQVVNVGASVHRAGFLNAGGGCGSAAGKGEWVFGVTTDESLVLRSFNHTPGGGEEGEEDAEGESAGDVGDVRGRLDCEYVVDVLRAGSTGAGGIVVAGNKEVGKQRVDLVPLRWTGGGQWGFTSEDRVRLQGGHGEEVCRGVWVDEGVCLLSFLSFLHALVREEESGRILMGNSPRRSSPAVRMGLSRFGGRRRAEGRVCLKGRRRRRRRRGRGRGRRRGRRRDSSLIDSRSETAWWIVLARVGLRYGKSC